MDWSLCKSVVPAWHGGAFVGLDVCGDGKKNIGGGFRGGVSV